MCQILINSVLLSPKKLLTKSHPLFLATSYIAVYQEYLTASLIFYALYSDEHHLGVCSAGAGSALLECERCFSLLSASIFIVSCHLYFGLPRGRRPSTFMV